MISDNNHIIYSAEDIQRYWSGKLSPQEMHAMEKAALDDPFLADAMEGMGLALQEHDAKMLNAQLAGIHQQVEARATGTAQRASVRSIRWWQVAAAAFVLVAAGYWIFSSARLEKDTLAKTQSPVNVSDVAATKTDSAPKHDTDYSSGFFPAPNAQETSANKAVQPKEPGLQEFHTYSSRDKKKDSESANISPSDPITTSSIPSGLENAKKKALELKATRQQTLPQASVPDTARRMETEVIKVHETFADREKAEDLLSAKEPKLQNVIKGVVTDNRNNPLPNVFIRLDNKSNAYNTNAYTTDLSGNFKIPAADSVINVSVSLQGYATQNFQLRSNTFNGAGMEADNQIKLQTYQELAANQSAYRKKAFDKKSDGFNKDIGDIGEYKITDQDAQPVYGWLSYEQYLEKNKRIPASNPNLTGEVAVSFEINKKGERSAYEIEKSLSAAHDAEAIRLVREGPAWKLTKGRKSRVTVIVRF